MTEQDTVRLLRECDAGIKMGVDAINNVFDSVESDGLKTRLNACRREHEKLKEESEKLLESYNVGSKPPAPISDAMAKMKTKFEVMMDPTDETIADLMTDGCNMGVKSLSRYLNMYKAADEKSKDITKRLISLEEKLAQDIRGYL